MSRDDRVVRIAVPVFIALVTFVAFLPALRAGFVSWDDDKNFLANPNYRGLGLTHLRWMWSTFLLGHYVPLSWMTLGLDYSLWEMNPSGYHLTNILLHATNAVVLYFVARRILRLAGAVPPDSGAIDLAIPAAIAALLFAVHPLRVESVAWVTERRDVLSELFYLLSVLFYLRFAEGGARRWYWLALAVFAAALLSKATPLTAPAVLLILNVYPLRRLGTGDNGWWGAAARRVYLELIPFAVLSAGAVAMTFVALQPMAQLQPLQKMAVSAYSLAFYLWKTILPLGLSPIYAMPVKVDPGAAVYVASYAVGIGISVAVWMKRRRWPGLAAAWLAFLAIIFPLLGFHQNGPQIAADRYTYHAAPALAILVGGIFALLQRRISLGRWIPVAGAAALVLTMGALTWKQNEIWHDSTTLWSHVLDVDSSSAYGRNNWGNLLMAQGKVADASEQYARALTAAPDYAQAHNNFGIALARQGRLSDAVAHYQRALAIEPGYAEPHSNWGIALAQQGDLAGAIDHYRQAIAIDPNSPDAHVNWGNALVRMGKPDEAIDHYRDALRIRPDDADAHLNWGVVLAQRGKLGEAINHFRQTLAIDPHHAEAKRYLDRATQLLRP